LFSGGRSADAPYNVYSGRGSSENVPFSVMGSEGVTPGNFPKNIGANICNLVHFVDEIRIYGVQDRGVHGSGKSHWNVIPMPAFMSVCFSGRPPSVYDFVKFYIRVIQLANKYSYSYFFFHLSTKVSVEIL